MALKMKTENSSYANCHPSSSIDAKGKAFSQFEATELDLRFAQAVCSFCQACEQIITWLDSAIANYFIITLEKFKSKAHRQKGRRSNEREGQAG